MANYRPGIVFIGMETSGALRRRFQALGFETYSCDLLPSEDGGEDRWKDRARTYGGIADALVTYVENRLDPWA